MFSIKQRTCQRLRLFSEQKQVKVSVFDFTSCYLFENGYATHTAHMYVKRNWTLILGSVDVFLVGRNTQEGFHEIFVKKLYSRIAAREMGDDAAV